MRRFVRPNIAGELILAALTLAAQDAGSVPESVFVRDSEIFLGTKDKVGGRRLTADGLAKSSPVLSPARRQIAFVRDPQGRAMADLVVISTAGRLLREIHFRPTQTRDSGMRFVEGLQWIGEERIVANGGVNPSTVEYAVVDLKTSEEVAIFLADGFTWVASPDGKHSAYVGHIPHFIPEDRRRPQLCLDDECVFDRPYRGFPDTETHVEFLAAPTWAHNSAAVAILAEQYESKAKEVIVRPLAGKALRIPVPADADGEIKLSWDEQFLTLIAGERRWKLDKGVFVFAPK